ncbi:SH3 domain-containing protein [Candidatus Latescibacterota bacterium]
MRKVALIIFIILSLMHVIFGAVVYAEDLKPRHAPNTLPGVEPEMLNPEYWISLHDDADTVIMTEAEIGAFNEKVRNKSVGFRDYYGKPDPLERDYVLNLSQGLNMNPMQILDLPGTVSGDSLRIRFQSNIEWLYSRDFYDNRNATYSDEMRDDIVDDMNIIAIPDVIERRFGIFVNHINVRIFPTDVPGYSDTQWELDYFQSTGTCLGNPVAVLHQSTDGEFLYVESPITRGWVSTTDVAFADRDDISALTEDTNVLMAAEHTVPVYSDPSCRNFSRYMYMSATMPYIGRNGDGYIVKMANRLNDGSLGLTNGYIRPGADVHIGRLSYTKRNIINQLFKLLNKPYGFHDQDNKRSCAGTMRILLRCFGIITGRTPSFLLSAPDEQFYMNPGLSTDLKIAEADKLEPVITMAGNAFHIVLYLGKARNGELYFMHQAGWGYDDDDGRHLIVNRTSLNWVRHKWYDIHRPNVFATFR